MIAIVSDFHLQHTGLDPIRYRMGGHLVEAGVERNIRRGAFERFARTLAELADRRSSSEVHLVFAGDIFELHRTPLWFTGTDSHVRPIDPLGGDTDSNPLRGRVAEILRALEEEHTEFWEAIREFATTTRGRRWRVVTHYLPGNHDRLANAWPSVRKTVRRLLGMDANAGAPFPNVLDFTSGGIADYGVRIRHGHEYDPSNFAHTTAKTTALDKTWRDYLEPAFGDYITVDVAMRLALAFRARYAASMRQDTDSPTSNQRADRLRRLYLDLTEFDDVRPTSLLVDYLVQRMGADQNRTFEFLKPTLRDTVEVATANPFFKRHAKKHVPGPLLSLLPALINNLRPKAIEDAIRLFTGKDSGPSSPAERAVEEFRHQPKGAFDLVIGGHTHRPEQVPLGGVPNNGEPFYLNSGTWRTTIPAGVNGFGRLRAYTLIFCYDRAEQAHADSDGRRFETWTGNLSCGALGPYVRRLAEPSGDLPTRCVRFEALEVKSTKKDPGGAELRVNFGVDQHCITARWDHVRPGDVLAVNAQPIVPDPALDGELWFYGHEEDWGPTGINPHDLLPWALGRLERTEANGPFRTGEGQLEIRGINQGLFGLRYRVEPVA